MHFHHHDRLLHLGLDHLEPSERAKADLLLVRVLRAPAEVGAAVDHPQLHLEDDAGLARGSRRVGERHRSVLGRRHEGGLDAAAHVVLAPHGVVGDGQEGVGQQPARQAAVDAACLGKRAQFHQRRVDHVQCGRVQVAQAEPVKVGLHEGGHVGRRGAQRRVVLDEEGPCVGARADHLLVGNGRVARVAQTLVDVADGVGELGERLGRAAVGCALGVVTKLLFDGPLADAERCEAALRVGDEPPLDLARRVQPVVAGREKLLRILAAAVLAYHGRAQLWRRRADEVVEASKEKLETAVGQLEAVGKLGLILGARVRHRGGQLGARREDERCEVFEQAASTEQVQHVCLRAV
mmetsp:Transcript_18933/g.40854  ORF Transcript_18933/g.40854 Transcript_18933/m.40854 type:complete len:351 (-) Transcript_18933:978-2030(-)